ncbi:aldehyde ferredoxin oxidoreductase C-terminal domain-containing protein [Candidatus Oleimmundimicrobium sp.]|uniref:aldehyde ferredoxin oxidoreductase family protein n=1 Tax=Candidatus Oleimmundimicrobium sp. TaxID=3060597 RepID=UPI00271F5658|nr:aldehyde ferredoxin oxidoreductase C-terminal domain-containing protein [Candidatus Oleimmundimicrobium sp.]MDO8885421.1 aldehyde ferredoxin oxidoreductase C-terminal domain-containing protein [Candidatus Oleimmundimicrobium sp.]
MSKIIRVNLTKKEVKLEDVSKEYDGLGGRGFTSAVVAAEVNPLCHPLGEENKLVIAPGLLGGTNCPNSGRVSFGAKSPLTGGIKESNVGGTLGVRLAKLQIAGIIIEGKAKDGESYVLLVNKDGATLKPSNELKNELVYNAVEKLRAKYGEKVAIACIGPAGEAKMAAANISVTDIDGVPTRQAGRGGLGAVMGSKGIKAIVVDGTDAPGVNIKDKDSFNKAAKVFADTLKKDSISGEGLPLYGTAILINILNEAGALPTKNFSSGRFEEANNISGETMREIILKRKGNPTHPCSPGCIIDCSNVYKLEDGTEITGGFEYESIWALGANCGIGDLDIVARLNRLCDDIGLDTIEMGDTIGVAMEAGIISFGDGEGAINLLKEAEKGSPLGKIVGSGCTCLGKVYGIERVPQVKGQGMPAYDPRATKGTGVTYATSPMGADHTAGYVIAMEIAGCGGKVDPLDPKGKADLSKAFQVATAATDCTGLCLFVAFATLTNERANPAVVDMLNAMYGLKLTGDDVTKLGKKVLQTERDFNKRVGFTKAHDRLPLFMTKEKLPPHNTVFDVSNEDLDSVHED